MNVLIPEISNSSSTITENNLTTNMTAMVFDDAIRNCTPLHKLDLVDAFAKMDVGSTEFWGSSNVVWMTFFIMYCILFYAALFGVFFYWDYILYSFRYRIKPRFLLRYYSVRYRLLYLITLQIFWFAFSFVHGILIISTVASGRDNRAVAVAIRTIETATSFSFVNIIITAPQVFFPWFSLIRITLSNLIIYLLGIAIIVVSLVGNSATFIVELIIFRSLMFIASVILLVLILYFKAIFFMRRQDKGLYIIIAFLYFLISYSYFLYTLSTVASNGNCIENVQLHRAVWLVLNYLLRICEVSFFILKARVFIMESKPCVSKRHSKRTHYCETPKVSNFRETKGSTTYHIPTKSLKQVEEDIFDARDSEEKFQQIKVVKLDSQKIEVEQLSHTPSVNVTSDERDCEVHTQNVKCIQLSSYQSAVHNQLRVASPSVSPDQNSYAGNLSDGRDTLTNMLDGKAMLCVS